MTGNDVASTSPGGAAFKDRRTGLMIFGILEIILGCMIALLVPLMIAGQIMTARITHEPPALQQVIPGAAFYGVFAVVLIGLGIGSCGVRRWARALSLIVSWSWLVFGVLGVAVMAFFLPSILEASPVQGQPLPGSARLVVIVVSSLFMGLFFLAVPGVLIIFYQSRHVRATCEARDPVPGWTDTCPLPVLGLSLWLALSSVAMLLMPVSMQGVMPVFGRLLSGMSGSLLYLLFASLWGYSAWAVYHLRVVGWWIVLISLAIMTCSMWLTLTQIDLMEMYRAMGYPERQIDMMKQFSFMQGSQMTYLSVSGVVPMIGFLLFVKRYFRRAR